MGGYVSVDVYFMKLLLDALSCLYTFSWSFPPSSTLLQAPEVKAELEHKESGANNCGL